MGGGYLSGEGVGGTFSGDDGSYTFSMNSCQCCGSATTNPRFCSRSCSAKVTNRTHPRRSVEPQNLCLGCGKRLSRRIGSRKEQRCKSCRESTMDTMTKAEAYAVSLSWGSKRGEAIRQHAKRLIRRLGLPTDRCEACGAEGATDLCHLRAIKDFPDDAPVSEINCRENLSNMCRCCHGLHDAGLLFLIRTRS